MLIQVSLYIFVKQVLSVDMLIRMRVVMYVLASNLLSERQGIERIGLMLLTCRVLFLAFALRYRDNRLLANMYITTLILTGISLLDWPHALDSYAVPVAIMPVRMEVVMYMLASNLIPVAESKGKN